MNHNDDESAEKLAAVMSENQNLRMELLNYKVQVESLEEEVRYQSTKAAEMNEIMKLNQLDEGDMVAKIAQNSILVAEKSMEIDNLKMQLKEVTERERAMIDEEREANVAIIAELKNIIIEQQRKINKYDGSSSGIDADEKIVEVVQRCHVSKKQQQEEQQRPSCEKEFVTGNNSKSKNNLVQKEETVKVFNEEFAEIEQERTRLLLENNEQKQSICQLEDLIRDKEIRHTFAMNEMKDKLLTLEENCKEKDTIQKRLEEEIQLLKKEKDDHRYNGEEEEDNLSLEERNKYICVDKTPMQLLKKENVGQKQTLFMNPRLLVKDSRDDDLSMAESTVYTTASGSDSVADHGANTIHLMNDDHSYINNIWSKSTKINYFTDDDFSITESTVYTTDSRSDSVVVSADPLLSTSSAKTNSNGHIIITQVCSKSDDINDLIADDFSIEEPMLYTSPSLADSASAEENPILENSSTGSDKDNWSTTESTVCQSIGTSEPAIYFGYTQNQLAYLSLDCGDFYWEEIFDNAIYSDTDPIFTNQFVSERVSI